MNRTFFYSILFSVSACVAALSGCAPTPYIAQPAKPRFDMPGIYHRVEKKETLWRISKMYSVDLEELVKINRIQDATSIEVGQLIFIPGLKKEPSPKAERPKANFDDFIWPLKGKVITSYGSTFNNMLNKGINIQPLAGQDVVASRSGRIVFYDDDFLSFGKTIIIDHGDGFQTVYARNNQVMVKVGDAVQKGAVVAKVGSSGRDKNTYLHFEIRKNHLPQNPNFYLSN